MSNSNMRLTIVTPSCRLMLYCAFFPLILGSSACLIGRQASAQVILRDTVRIGPTLDPPPAGPLSPTTTDTFFIAPRPGVLAIVPFWAHKLGAPLPNESYLEIRLSDTTYTPTLSPFLPCNRSFSNRYWWTCGTYTVGTEYLNDWCDADSSDTLYTRRLQAGDTVRFAFQGQFYNPGSIDWADYCNCGFVEMATPPPPGCQAPNDPNEMLWANVRLIDTVVTIRRPDSAVVYPSYRYHNNITTKRNYVDLEVFVTYKNAPVPNYWVRIDTSRVRNQQPADSGGHSHSHTSPRRPVGGLNHATAAGDTTNTRDTLMVRTDSNGKGRFRYVASQFGGVELIKARALSDTSRWDTVSLVTRVPELQLLALGTKYEKVGGTCQHHGPRDDTLYQNCRTPDNNHWGTGRLSAAIQRIAVAYDSLHPGIRLRINDMSLPYGGLFDVNGNWRPDHSEHRIGINADIGYEGLNNQNQRVSIDTTDIQKIIFLKTEKIWPLHHRPPGPPAPHFHMYVRRN